MWGAEADDGAQLRTGLDAIGNQFARQLFLPHDVHAPELLQPPGSHGGWIDCTDVGVRQERQTAQPFLGADARSQIARRGRIFKVAARHDQ